MIETLVERAVAEKLHTNHAWKSLLHYYDPEGFSAKLVSFVDGEKFFLAENGKNNSAEELAASIRALLSEQSLPHQDEVNDPRCRFVEREKWLRDSLGLTPEPVPEHCTKYHDWRNGIDAHSVTLVFPASYLNSPSSMFGHTLFRFDPENLASDSSLLSYSISYAADASQQDENSFGYAYKGIAGGYPGRFNVVPYFKKLQEYGALENRDVWEYKLDLKPKEVERMLNHTWELSDVHFDYFYLRENCAYRLLELLDYARPSLRLADQFKNTAIPATTVKAVVKAGIVEDVNYRPSIGTELQHNLSLIDKKNRFWVESLADNPDLVDSENFQKLDSQTQQSLLLTANLYLTYSSRRGAMSDNKVKKRFSMLRKISRYPAKKPAVPPVPIRPDKGHDTSLLAVGVGRDNGRDYSEINYRISYHDLLDNVDGYLRGSQIELGDFRLRHYSSGGARIEGFDLITIRSLSSWYSIFDSISWEVEASFSRDDYVESDKMSFKLEGSAGKGVPLGDSYVVYGLFGPGANVFSDSAEHSLYINAHAKLGALQYNSYGTAILELTAESIQHKAARFSLGFGQNIVLSRDHALRLELEVSQVQDETTENGKLSYRYSF